MKLPVPNIVRVTALKHITSKNGNALTFATLANKETYEVLTCKLSLSEGQSLAVIAEGCDYQAVIEYDGEYSSVTLTPTTQTTPKANSGFQTQK